MGKISIPDARYLALYSQLLLKKHPAQNKRDLLKIIEQLRYIQIDTISVVERAHKHVLWTRFPGYRNELLDELIDKDKKVFEFWDHAASYLPMKHYRYSLRRKEGYAKKYAEWKKENKKLLKYILDRIKSEGALMSRDFEDPKKRGPWWDWKPAKRGLEFLFHSGELMLKARRNFQKVYDLPERILPGNIDTAAPTEEEFSEFLITNIINSNGLASLKDITYLRSHHAKTTNNILKSLIEDKKIIPIGVEGIEKAYYTTSKSLRLLKTRKEDEPANSIHILSPFDNLVIRRKRLGDLFGLDYVIECYVPAGKRKFGYFCLPVLYGDKFIARIDAKADRKKDELRVINLFPEDGVKIKGRIRKQLEEKLKELANFSGCGRVKL